MIKILDYSQEKIGTWNDFVGNSKNGIFMFDRNYMDYHSDRFKDNSLMFYEEDELIAIMPASVKNNIIYSHGGLTFGGIISSPKMKQHRMNECFDELIKYLREKNIKSLIYKPTPYIYHKIPSQEDLYSLWKSEAEIIKRDVSSTINLQNQVKMPKGRKAQISRAKREGVMVAESEDFENFINLENEILKKYHDTKAVHTAAELILLKSRFPAQIHLYLAKQEDVLLAGTVIFEYENIVHTQYMANSDKGREIGALDLLISKLIDKYKDSKKYFDFGISTEDCGRILNLGLCSQKEGFGGRTTIYETYELKV
jgi:hypothetical protein